MKKFAVAIPHLSEEMDAMHENRINKVANLGKKSIIIGNVTATAYIVIYIILGAIFGLPDKIGGAVYGYILPATITFLCYFLPILFFRRKIKKITLTGVSGIKLVK